MNRTDNRLIMESYLTELWDIEDERDEESAESQAADLAEKEWQGEAPSIKAGKEKTAKVTPLSMDMINHMMTSLDMEKEYTRKYDFLTILIDTAKRRMKDLVNTKK